MWTQTWLAAWDIFLAEEDANSQSSITISLYTSGYLHGPRRVAATKCSLNEFVECHPEEQVGGNWWQVGQVGKWSIDRRSGKQRSPAVLSGNKKALNEFSIKFCVIHICGSRLRSAVIFLNDSLDWTPKDHALRSGVIFLDKPSLHAAHGAWASHWLSHVRHPHWLFWVGSGHPAWIPIIYLLAI